MHAFLNDCHRIESVAGRIYRHLAEARDYPPELRRLFDQLATDELEHARQIELLLQAPAQEIRALNCISSDMIDASVRNAEQLLLQVDGRRPLAAEQALRLAVELENRFVKVHVHNSLQFEQSRLAALFADLGRYDQTHVDQLRDGLAWWRRQVAPGNH